MTDPDPAAAAVEGLADQIAQRMAGDPSGPMAAGAVPGVVGVGIDAVDIARLAAILDRRPGLATRLFTPEELDWIRFCANCAAQMIPPGHRSQFIPPAVLDRVNTVIAVSRERNESDCAAPELDRDEIVGTAEAAQIMGCSQRRVQQRIAAGDLAAELVGRNYLLRRVNLTDGQETQHR